MYDKNRITVALCAMMLGGALWCAPRPALAAAIPPDFAAVASSYGAPADFDCDHRADISRRIHNGIWEIDLAANGFGHRDLAYAGYGDATAIPVPADYDGDCRADLAAKDAGGSWYIDYARDGFGAWNEIRPGYGPETSIPVPADYDGDGKTDLAAKDAGGGWYIDYAFNGFGTWNAIYYGYGDANAVPVPADYDGDRRADLSVKADNGCWYIDYASDGFGAWNAINCGWGNASQLPVPADYDGDGKADLAVKSADHRWYIDYAAGGFGGWNAVYLGWYAQNVYGKIEPLPADYDGDGKADLSLHSLDEFWYIDFSGNGFGNTAPFDLRDALGVPVMPKVTLDGHTAHSLKISVTALGPDLQGRSSAEQVKLSANGFVSGSFGTTTWRDVTNLASDTNYCVTSTAINGEGSRARTDCFRTDYEAPPPPPPTPAGVSRINVFNCHSDKHTVHIWTYDYTLGAWLERGSVAAQWDSTNSCPGSAAPFVVELADGHNFRFVAVDPQQLGCGGVNDPQNGGCQRSIITVVTGLASGPAYRHVIN